MLAIIKMLVSFLISIVLGIPAGLLGMLGVPTETHIRNDEKPVNVFIGGLLGFGEKYGAYYIMPSFAFWENTLRRLEGEGYECYAVSAGVASSNWDRACNLYAELTGTQVDYGKAHSERHGHARYGRTYKKPLFEGWGERRMNLLGYSQGGQTMYLLAHLLAEGCADERAATPKEELSPLFAGGQGGLVHSVTSLAGTLNGTSICATYYDREWTLPYFILFSPFLLIGSIGPLNGMYDIFLDNFGLSGVGIEKTLSIPCYRDFEHFLNSGDHALYDMSPGGTQEMNHKTDVREDVYYFSYTASVTQKLKDDCYIMPLEQMFYGPFGFIFGVPMALGWTKFEGKTYDSPAGPFTVDEEWYNNDGIVNTISQAYPFGAPHKAYDAKRPERGTWQVMPHLEGTNHFFFCGMDWSKCPEDLFQFYLGHMRVLDGTYG